MFKNKVGTIYQDGTYYSKNPTGSVADSPFKAFYIKKILQRNNISFATCCEVGCGAGEILTQLSKTYTETSFVGYEVSEQAYELCQSRKSSRISFKLKDPFSDKLASPFDLLLIIDVIEHVEDFFGFVRNCRKMAKYTVFLIPLDMNAMWVLRGYPILDIRKKAGHLHYFSPETALATLKESGYELIDHLYAPLGAKGILGNQFNRKRKPSIYRKLLNKLIGKPFTTRIVWFYTQMKQFAFQSLALYFCGLLLSKLIGQPATARIYGKYSLIVLARPVSEDKTLQTED